MRAELTIDLDAIAENWRALDAQSTGWTETGAVVKADAYGLGAARVAPALARAGAKSFFVALAEEGAALREALGSRPEIYILGGYMPGDLEIVREHDLTPVLNSAEQVRGFAADAPGTGCAVQLDSGMNRLGIEGLELPALMLELNALRPKLVISHLACAEEPAHPLNAMQLGVFQTLALGFPGIRRSLAATGGILLGPAWHFELTRPGIGLYGGLPFNEARPVVGLSLPVIQIRDVAPGEIVGYGGSWTATRPSRIATLSAGYADGLIRAMGGRARVFAGDTPCPLAGRVSMDLLTVDVTDLDAVPERLEVLGPHQGIDALAEAAGTIGHEVLTALGSRYARVYKGGDN